MAAPFLFLPLPSEDRMQEETHYKEL